MATRVLRTPSVLLVNDALDEREMYARTLRAVGYRAMTAANSTAAYQIAVTCVPSIVVTDVRIAGSLNGLELTRRLRTNERTSAVGIIVLTSVSRPHDANVALKAGADVILGKPVSGSVLKVEVARLLGMSEQRLSAFPPQGQSFDAAASELGSTRSSGPTGTGRKCPWCDGTVAYRHRWPILTTGLERAAIERERMLYASGWFCTNTECDYRRLLWHDE